MRMMRTEMKKLSLHVKKGTFGEQICGWLDKSSRAFRVRWYLAEVKNNPWHNSTHLVFEHAKGRLGLVHLPGERCASQPARPASPEG